MHWGPLGARLKQSISPVWAASGTSLRRMDSTRRTLWIQTVPASSSLKIEPWPTGQHPGRFL